MTVDKYNKVFMDVFELPSTDGLPSLRYRESEKWDSIGHMMLCAALEDAFDIHLEGEDILEIQSYEIGITVLGKYGVVFD